MLIGAPRGIRLANDEQDSLEDSWDSIPDLVTLQSLEVPALIAAVAISCCYPTVFRFHVNPFGWTIKGGSRMCWEMCDRSQFATAYSFNDLTKETCQFCGFHGFF